jgi:hypothetical protein
MPINKPSFPNLRPVKKAITPEGEVLERKECAKCGNNLWAERSSLDAMNAENANELDLDFRHHGLFSFILAIRGGDRYPRDADENSSSRGAIILVDGSDFRNRRGNRPVELWMEAYMRGVVS